MSTFRLIYLTQNQFAIVDAEDFEQLSKHTWSLARTGYAYSSCRDIYSTKHLLMHRQIKAVPEGKEIDHWNGNRLDNRRCNIRIVPRNLNDANRFPIYEMVVPHKLPGKWQARLRIEKEWIYFGPFDNKNIALQEAEKQHQQFFDKYSYFNRHLAPSIPEITDEQKHKAVQQRESNKREKCSIFENSRKQWRGVKNEKGEKFPSSSHAAKAYKLKRASSIHQAIQLGCKAGGTHWFYENQEISIRPPAKAAHAAVRVKNSKGEIFKSMREASKTYGFPSVGAIQTAVRKGCKASNLQWYQLISMEGGNPVK